MEYTEKKVRFTSAGGRKEYLSRAELEEITYQVQALTDYQGIGGQGDVEHRWTYLCTAFDGRTVTLEEVYDLSWWTPGGPSAQNISFTALVGITETAVSEDEARQLLRNAREHICRRVCLPVSLSLK